MYISFPHAWWDGADPASSRPPPSPSSSMLSVSASDPDTTSSSEEASTAASTVNPAVTTFLPDYSSAADLARPATQEAMSLSRLPAPHAHPTLLFYTSAAVSRKISAGLPAGRSPFLSTNPAADERARGIMEHFGPLLDALPRRRRRRRRPSSSGDDGPEEREEGAPTPRPSAVLATNWLADELAGRGSYTFFPAGLARGDEHVRALRRGAARERRVWVAGEHAAPFVALGTLTGAWWSGETVAERILGFKGDEDEEEK